MIKAFSLDGSDGELDDLQKSKQGCELGRLRPSTSLSVLTTLGLCVTCNTVASLEDGRGQSLLP